MNIKLPKVYVNHLDRQLPVNQVQTSLRKDSQVSLDTILDDHDKYLFNHRYLITLKNNKVIESSIISKKNNKVLTIDNDAIDVDEIKTIIEIKK